MSRQNRHKQTQDLELISDAEIWFVIRYLDPDLRRKPSQITPYIALIVIVVLVAVIWFSLYLRGL